MTCTIENPDQIKLSFWGPAHTHETEIVYEETDINSRIFAAADRQSTIEVKYPLPSTEGDIIAKRFKQTVPGTEKMKFDLYYSGEVISLEVPIWKGPGYGTNETRVEMYAASNQVFNKSDCEDLNPEDYITKNTKMFIKVVDPGARRQTVKALISSSVDATREVTCAQVKPGVFLSGGIVPIDWEFPGTTINLFNSSYDVLKVNPNNQIDKGEIELKYTDTRNRESVINVRGKKSCLLISCFQLYKDISLNLFDKLFGIDPLYNEAKAFLTIVKTNRTMTNYYNVIVNHVPMSDFFHFSSKWYCDLSKYDVIYINAHATSEYFLVYKDQTNWLSGENPTEPIFKSDIFAIALQKVFSSTLVILNGCNTAVDSEAWKGAFKTRCLIGWKGKVMTAKMVVFFDNFFEFILNAFIGKGETTIMEAFDYAKTSTGITGATPVIEGISDNTNLVP
ncbi:MAG: hypothetical protein PHQ23_07980 [Candidatus Wallbacteria bacterium]|nr:hypothetical protein [Candidatus Wallbacteria bacterium]